MELLYFDFDHGVEKLLFVRLDPESQSVQFRIEKGADPTHDEDGTDVPTLSITASTNCSNLEEFFGFSRALVAAMRETPFLLQDPAKPPFAAMPQETLVLEEFGEGLPATDLTCRIPPEIATELLGSKRLRERFKHLIGSDE